MGADADLEVPAPPQERLDHPTLGVEGGAPDQCHHGGPVLGHLDADRGSAVAGLDDVGPCERRLRLRPAPHQHPVQSR